MSQLKNKKIKNHRFEKIRRQKLYFKTIYGVGLFLTYAYTYILMHVGDIRLGTTCGGFRQSSW